MNNTEFYAENPSLHPSSCFGCRRWEKDYMVSFFGQNIKGERYTYEGGIDKVFDVFLDEKSMEKLFEDWQRLKKEKK